MFPVPCSCGGVPGLPGDEGLTDFGPGPDVGDVISEPMSGAPLARHLAKKLGLDETRSKAQTQNQMQGPALARDLLLEGYVHLLR